MPEAKPYAIPKQLVWDAYQRVKANRGAAGVDGESLTAFEKDLKGNLYKVWNRMSSGSYFPPPVRLVEIPKDNGGTRPLGIPTVADRVAQTVVKMVLEPVVDTQFHPDSYGDPASRRSTRSERRGSDVGTRTGSSTWTSKVSLIPSRMTSSSAPWRITPTFHGCGCTLRGGFVHRCSVQTARWMSGQRARRKAESSVRCSRISSCTTRSTGGCSGRFRPSNSSAMRTMPSSIAGVSGRHVWCWTPSVVDSCSAVWSFIQRRLGLSTARTPTDRGSTNTWRSTSSGTPSNRDEQRIAGGNSS